MATPRIEELLEELGALVALEELGDELLPLPVAEVPDAADLARRADRVAGVVAVALAFSGRVELTVAGI